MLIDTLSGTPQPTPLGEVPPSPDRGGFARYALQPGLSLLPACPTAATSSAMPAEGGVLFSMRPLMAMRLNREAFALLGALDAAGGDVIQAAAAAKVSPVDAAAFFDQLAGRRLLQRSPPPARDWPRISIIIAARGRHRATRACVESLLLLDYPKERRDIIVVDDATDPPLAPSLAGLPICLITLERNHGQSAARNLAAIEAEGELLAFIDNDCIADPAWLATLVPYFEDAGVAIVGGRVMSPKSNDPVATFEAVRSPLDMGAIEGPVGPSETVAYLPTCNFLIRRDAFLAVGGFVAEMRLGEDVDLTWRVLDGGARAYYVPAKGITHHHRQRLIELLRRRADYASSEADLQQRHPRAHRVLPAPRLSLLFLAMLAAILPAWPVALGLALAIAGLIYREVDGKRRQIDRLGVALPASRVGVAVLREHLASMHSLSANTIRYYGLPLLMAGVVWPVLLPAVLVLALCAPIVDHRRLKPACGLLVFVGLYWLEMLAYQAGVWRGCITHRTFAPLLPRLHWRR